MIDISCALQILGPELMTSTRKNVPGFQLLREMVKKSATISPRLDFDDDVVRIRA